MRTKVNAAAIKCFSDFTDTALKGCAVDADAEVAHADVQEFIVRPTYPDRLFLSGFERSWLQTGGVLIHRDSQL